MQITLQELKLGNGEVAAKVRFGAAQKAVPLALPQEDYPLLWGMAQEAKAVMENAYRSWLLDMSRQPDRAAAPLAATVGLAITELVIGRVIRLGGKEAYSGKTVRVDWRYSEFTAADQQVLDEYEAAALQAALSWVERLQGAGVQLRLFTAAGWVDEAEPAPTSQQEPLTMVAHHDGSDEEGTYAHPRPD